MSGYSDQVGEGLTTNCNIADAQLGLKISMLKPLHTSRLLHAFDFAAEQTDVLKHGWEEPSLLIIIAVILIRRMSGTKNDFEMSDCKVNRLLMVTVMYAYWGIYYVYR